MGICQSFAETHTTSARETEAPAKQRSNRGCHYTGEIGCRSHRSQLAERLKTDQGNIARLERGRSPPTIRTLQRNCRSDRP
jgi:transcriptional regulator with XRE-family HTH domain